MIGVAISTTGDSHRLALLDACVDHWVNTLGYEDQLVVTVDGDEEAVDRVWSTLTPWPRVPVLRVGQPTEGWHGPLGVRDGRLGVAANKNTGIEALMHGAADHIFLSDDDTWPVSRNSLDLHMDLGLPHSMVCWGEHRRMTVQGRVAAWTWPRGAVLYAQRSVLVQLGGMIEAFGPGGHEHVEWSRRIHHAGLTPMDYPTPVEYAADRWMGARAHWHAEDMPRIGENRATLISRRRHLTSVRREPQDPAVQSKIMAERLGDTSFVPYKAHLNRRWSATLFPTTSA